MKTRGMKTLIENAARDAVHFWFDEIDPKMQFKKNPEFDAQIRARFLPAYEAIVAYGHSDWLGNPEISLGIILILDQFARNMFRDDPRAFAEDWRALELTRALIEKGADVPLDKQRRYFSYMPLMHSEDRDVHELALEKFTALGHSEALRYEVAHKDIIDRFGRYPHRNACLGRENTPEEDAFLKTNNGF